MVKEGREMLRKRTNVVVNVRLVNDSSDTFFFERRDERWVLRLKQGS